MRKTENRNKWRAVIWREVNHLIEENCSRRRKEKK